MKAPNTKIAVTLFNLREHCKTYEDLDATLEKVKDMGYQAVQVSAVKLPPKQIKELVDKHGLYVCATHEGLPALRDEFDDIVVKLKTLECEFTALGSPGSEDVFNPEGVKRFASEMDEIGAKFKAEGLKFGFHNHHREFVKVTDKIFLEELYDSTNPEHLYAEIDVHWVTRGGGNPEAWIRKVAGRMPVIHFKDFAFVDGEPKFCEIGEGNLDWPGIIKACEDTGVRWYSIEQDQPFGDRDIFASMALSFNNLKAMGVE